MKSLTQINNLLKQFENQYGLNISNAKQGSEEWFKLKLGVLSASNASKIVAKKDSETRFSYMCELVGQICTGEQEEINSKYLKWGNDNEAAARSSYEFQENVKTDQVLFVFKDDKFREGCSPDSILPNKGVEIKCPYTAREYVKFFSEESLKTEWKWQMQFQIRALDCYIYDMAQYHPNMKTCPLKIVQVERDEKMQKTLEDAIPQFIWDMDEILKKLDVRFGFQWNQLLTTEEKTA